MKPDKKYRGKMEGVIMNYVKDILEVLYEIDLNNYSCICIEPKKEQFYLVFEMTSLIKVYIIQFINDIFFAKSHKLLYNKNG